MNTPPDSYLSLYEERKSEPAPSSEKGLTIHATGQSLAPLQEQGPSVYLGTLEAGNHALEAALRPLVKHRQANIAAKIAKRPESERDQFRRDYNPLGLGDYCEAVGRMGTIQRQRRARGDYNSPESLEVLKLADIFDRDEHTPDVPGWLAYLQRLSPNIADALDKIPAPKLPESTRRENTLIVAARGRGKSELMKALIYHHVTTPTAAVVVIDPHGDMASQVAHWPEFAGNKKLVYIEPRLVPEHTPRLNPLTLGRSLPENLRGAFAQQLARTLTELVPEAELTANMMLLVTSCVRLLLDEENATLVDLYRLLEDKPSLQSQALIAKGRQHKNMMLATFFAGDFHSDSFKASKAGLRNRLMSLLSSEGFFRLVCAPGCIDLEHAIANKKTIVFKLGSLGADEAVAAGRLVLMMLWSLGHRRMQDNTRQRAPVHVFVDEATKLAGKAIGEILSELRKVGVHLTLAQQVTGDGFTKDVRERVISGTAIKFAGANDSNEMAKVLRTDARLLGKLADGEFWCRWGEGQELVKVRVRNDLADDSHAMPQEAWAALVESWCGKVYHKIPPQTATEAPTTPVKGLSLD